MRVVPFFYSPGFYKNNILVDGGFSAYYSIPEDQDKDKIVTISPWKFLCPHVGPDRLFNPVTKYLYILIITILKIFLQMSYYFCIRRIGTLGRNGVGAAGLMLRNATICLLKKD